MRPAVAEAARFAAARLRELDQAAARATVPFAHEWTADAEPPTQHVIDGLGIAVASGANSVLEFIALNDPARAFRLAAAGRRIVRMHERCGTGSGHCDDTLDHAIPGIGCPDILNLASGWEGHPDFDADWAREICSW